ncbi:MULTISPECIES: helix-turn-helix transcriptional regulator [Staphylococcus]|uniref:helix-turn-helix transcriptional regulator n=1 Tax=Staphylococcus TaxID=1279 RepID=UPI000E693B27|nr:MULTISPECIES: helix-turn-helix transcriptional regulator [Staphylococcus]MCD8910659.1 helix-turn-helix transcriptional regulator [Staphylococcus gallinarum]MDK9844513.1 helix-turn-helix transcriptional regulator [Staphylococcus equorum]MDW4355095.1 helix-turn-helix transcriptional regulator [Staphylococcus saprophyticus]RIL89058.1 XRE family transcriptional regulator [Staphylococcus cohnii]
MIVTMNVERVKEEMFKKGFNLTSLSKEVNCTVSYLSQILNRKRIPSSKLAKIISQVLEVDITDIFIFEQKEA